MLLSQISKGSLVRLQPTRVLISVQGPTIMLKVRAAFPQSFHANCGIPPQIPHPCQPNDSGVSSRSLTAEHRVQFGVGFVIDKMAL